MQLTITLPSSTAPITIRELLETQWLIPRKVRHFLRTRKNVLKNGEPIMFHELVQGGDAITLIFEDSDYPIPNIQLGMSQNVDVLWEDNHLIIVNKPAGQKTHPNQPEETGTLINDVAAYLNNKNQIPYVVHRLDKETSGAIVFAKNPIILPVLGRLLEQKGIKRYYEAEVSGLLNKQFFTIDKPIGRHRHDRRKRIIDTNHGAKAITHVTLLKTLSDSSIIECELDTGRTHQIRVHLNSIHHPIVGDPLYNPTSKAPRLQLHAKRLSLIHPFTNEKINVVATPSLFD